MSVLQDISKKGNLIKILKEFMKKLSGILFPETYV